MRGGGGDVAGEGHGGGDSYDLHEAGFEGIVGHFGELGEWMDWVSGELLVLTLVMLVGARRLNYMVELLVRRSRCLYSSPTFSDVVGTWKIDIVSELCQMDLKLLY